MSKLSKKRIENRVATVTNTHQASLKRCFRAVFIRVSFRSNAGGSSSLPSWTSTTQTAGHTYMDNEWEFFFSYKLLHWVSGCCSCWTRSSHSLPPLLVISQRGSHPSGRWGSLCRSEQDKSASERHSSVRCLTHGNEPAAFTALCCGSAPVFKDAEPLVQSHWCLLWIERNKIIHFFGRQCGEINT